MYEAFNISLNKEKRLTEFEINIWGESWIILVWK